MELSAVSEIHPFCSRVNELRRCGGKLGTITTYCRRQNEEEGRLAVWCSAGRQICAHVDCNRKILKVRVGHVCRVRVAVVICVCYRFDEDRRDKDIVRDHRQEAVDPIKDLETCATHA